MVYQTRNSNLLKHPNYKNKCWLNIDPNDTCDGIAEPDRLIEKEYILINNHLS